ncbi:hypothetical protein VQ056_15535 [Paenibacillus sp. JTLBN-2024]
MDERPARTGKFDIIMNTPAGGVNPSQPWSRAHDIMYSKGVAPAGEMAFWNWGRYKNDKADQIIDQIPTVTDEAQLKNLYTELTKIWLTDIPSVPLMYRPWVFHTVNESVWKGSPSTGTAATFRRKSPWTARASGPCTRFITEGYRASGTRSCSGDGQKQTCTQPA